ncbi:recombinase family protein [Paenibacillus sp. MMO-58]|uniref:recombinase family protein n=1 Tax=Paenibacillus sp. MMO-58 TaxID=3081290 RepID=UPI003019B754
MSFDSKRVAAYIRVSTEEQAAQGDSLGEQQERLTAYCKAMDWGTPVMYIEEGRSAKNLKRPELKRLIADVEAGKFDTVLTTKIDRLCRNLRDLLQTVDLFEQFDCSYVSASEHFDTSTSVGRMTLQLLGTFAEFERSRISDNVKATMTSIVKNTDRAMSDACYGYKVVDGAFEIVEEEAEFVRLMFDLVFQNMGYKKITEILNEKGSRTKAGNLWNQTSVLRLIKNEKVKGAVYHNKTTSKGDKVIKLPESDWIIKENNHPAIISPETFEKAHDVLRARAKAGRFADSETYLLTGYLKCGYCGANMRGKMSRAKGRTTIAWYVCSRNTSGGGCRYHSVNRVKIEAAILSELEAIYNNRDPEYLEKIVKQKPKKKDEHNELNEQLKKIDARIQKVIAGWTNGFITDEDMKKATARAEEERAEISEKLNNIKHEAIDVSSIMGRIAALNGMDRIEKKAALRGILDKIIYKDGEIELYLTT